MVGLRSTPVLRLLVLLCALVLGGRSGLASAGSLAVLDGNIHRLLNDDSGWTLHQAEGSNGVAVYAKPVPSLQMTAFKGVKRLAADVDPAHLFDLIVDIAGQKRFSSMLVESRVLASQPDSLAYFQVIRPPSLVPGSHRFWINSSAVDRAVGGERGHFKRSWSVMPATTMGEVRQDILGRYPDAVEVVISHGSWELDPQPDGSVLYIYRTVSHPGGGVPDGLARMLAGRTLPGNMLDFERAAAGD